MAKFRLQFPHGSFPYVVFGDQNGNVGRIDTLAFETYNATNYTTSKYCLFGIEVGATGWYDFTMPAFQGCGNVPYDGMVHLAISTNTPVVGDDPGGPTLLLPWDGSSFLWQLTASAGSSPVTVQSGAVNANNLPFKIPTS